MLPRSSDRSRFPLLLLPRGAVRVPGGSVWLYRCPGWPDLMNITGADSTRQVRVASGHPVGLAGAEFPQVAAGPLGASRPEPQNWGLAHTGDIWGSPLRIWRCIYTFFMGTKRRA